MSGQTQRKEAFVIAIESGNVSPVGNTGRYKCHVCNKEYSTKSSVTTHLNTKIHSNNIKACKDEPNATGVTAQSIKGQTQRNGALVIAIESGKVSPVGNTGRYKCHVCNKEYSTKSSVTTHLNTKIHSNNIKACKDEPNATGFTVQSIKCQGQSKIKEKNSALSSAIELGHVSVSDNHCFVCDKKYSSKGNLTSHLDTSTHRNNVLSWEEKPPEPGARNKEMQPPTHARDKKVPYAMGARDKEVPPATAAKDKNGKTYDEGKKISDKLGNAIESGMVSPLGNTARYKCHVCDKEYASKATVKKHLDTDLHRNNACAPQGTFSTQEDNFYKEDSEESRQTDELAKALQSGLIKGIVNPYRCDVCNRQLASKASFKNHLKSKMHEVNSGGRDGKKINDILRETDNFSVQIFSCKACYATLTADQVREHMRSEDHHRKVQAMAMDPDPNSPRDVEYPTSSESPYGQVHVFNYTEDRPGAKVDGDNLRLTFTKLGYSVKVYEDLTKSKTKMKIDEIREDYSLQFANSLFIFVMGHGKSCNEFLCSQNEPMTLDYLRNQFTDTKCPQMKNKPKIFMTNYCRGDFCELVETDNIEIPHDLVNIHAGAGGVKVLRTRTTGTLFISSLCYVLQFIAKSTDLRDIYYLLRDIMKRRKSHTPMWEDWGFKKYIVQKKIQ